MTDLINQFNTAIENKNLAETKLALEVLLENSNSTEVTIYIVTPANISKMHQQLIEAFNVPPRAMQLKHRVEHRGKRANLFIRAMLNGVNAVAKDNE